MFSLKGRHRLEPESITVCFLYDPTNGQIVHRHEVVNFAGGTRMDAKNVESDTFRLAAIRGFDTLKLKALVVSSGDYAPGKCYKIDLTTLRPEEVNLRASRGTPLSTSQVGDEPPGA